MPRVGYVGNATKQVWTIFLCLNKKIITSLKITAVVYNFPLNQVK